MDIKMRKDGGAAFPHVSAAGYVTEGMSLRDYFAGQALVGMLGGSFMPKMLGRDDWDFAAASYQMADAMLKVRKAK